MSIDNLNINYTIIIIRTQKNTNIPKISTQNSNTQSNSDNEAVSENSDKPINK